MKNKIIHEAIICGIVILAIFVSRASKTGDMLGSQVTNNVQSNTLDFSKIVDSATLDANFVVASAGYNNQWNGNFLLKDNLVVGSLIASGSNAYVAEFSNPATVSINKQGTSSNKGTCIQLQNTTGAPVFLRVYGTTLTVNAIKCR